MITKNKNQRICIFGMGFVGLTLSIVLAEKGFNIIGLEKNKLILKNLKKFKSQLFEPNIDNRLKKIIKKKKLILSSKLNKKLASDVYIITVGTPLNNKKKSNLKMINMVSNEICKFLKNDDHIILRSTVKVGTTQKLCETFFNKRKIRYTIGFCPERTIEGNALNELEYLPQIISGNTKQSIIKSKKIFGHLNKNFKTAEMIKLIDNMQRDVKFALSNEVAQICELLNINVNQVIRLGKKNYPRTNLFDPGPVGGPCLEKDTYILKDSLNNKYNPIIALSSRQLNENLIKNAVKKIKNLSLINQINIKKKIKIVICGLAFKGFPKTNDMRGSTVYPLIYELKKNFKNFKIYGHDELVDQKYFYSLKIQKIKKIIDIFNQTDLLIIHNNNPLYKKILSIQNISTMSSGSLIYDFWNNYEEKFSIKNRNINYYSLGNI